MSDDGLETLMNLILLRFGLIAAVVVVIAILIVAGALWLRRRGALDTAARRAAPVARRAAEHRRSERSDLLSAGLSGLATVLEQRGAPSDHDRAQTDEAARPDRDSHDGDA
ncbi:hypothetical protein ACSAGD_00470 [Paramicrobacterium sp. CJ85]|uniref:hypothetical protein n=1 Tax=Paramicrobacterium sp. CJ85 TaxID=3445355 RepID=UPI003F60CAC1